VCWLGCVEFIYTSVSVRCVVRCPEKQRAEPTLYLLAGGDMRSFVIVARRTFFRHVTLWSKCNDSSEGRRSASYCRAFENNFSTLVSLCPLRRWDCARRRSPPTRTLTSCNSETFLEFDNTRFSGSCFVLKNSGHRFRSKTPCLDCLNLCLRVARQ